MSCPICIDIYDKIQSTQQAINYYHDNIRHNEDRINYLTFIGVNRLGKRPYTEHLATVQRLHQAYTTLLEQLEHIRDDHHCYHSL